MSAGRRKGKMWVVGLSLGFPVHPVLHTALISSSQYYYNVGSSIIIAIFFITDAKVESRDFK